MRLVTLRRLVPLLLVAAISLAACGGDAPPSGPSPSPEIPANNATEAPLLPTDAGALPEMDPAQFDTLLHQLRGTPVLVNVWGSWCGPCRDEAPNLADAHRRYGDRVQFLGVDILDVREGAREFMREFGWTYPSVYDPPGAIRDHLGLVGQPWTLLYDSSGELIQRWVGPAPPAELDASLRGVVGS
jgi:cytochrome c biogenesis protein CcmG/thiol:disulfide interchange protein DsbE